MHSPPYVHRDDLQELLRLVEIGQGLGALLRDERLLENLGDLCAESGQTLQGSFSAGWLVNRTILKN